MRLLFAALLASGVWACSTTPHAVEYVVLKNGEGHQERPRNGDLAKLEAQAGNDDAYPIYDEARPEEGTGGSGCSPGLIGSECERGLLADEPPLDERTLLGEDRMVIEVAIDVHHPPPFSPPEATAGASGPDELPPEDPAQR